jgi:hypothetical protein
MNTPKSFKPYQKDVTSQTSKLNTSLSPHLSHAPSQKRIADLNFSRILQITDTPKTVKQKTQPILSTTLKPTADYLPSEAVPNQDVDMLGEYPPPFLPPPFQGINGLLPPKKLHQNTIQVSSEYNTLSEQQLFITEV